MEKWSGWSGRDHVNSGKMLTFQVQFFGKICVHACTPTRHVTTHDSSLDSCGARILQQHSRSCNPSITLVKHNTTLFCLNA